MIKYAMIKAILSALAVTAPIAETTYLDTGIYYSDIQSVVDSEGEEWGYDAELPDGTPVIITFDSQNTDSRYDDVITGLTEINMNRLMTYEQWLELFKRQLRKYIKHKLAQVLYGVSMFMILTVPPLAMIIHWILRG